MNRICTWLAQSPWATLTPPIESDAMAAEDPTCIRWSRKRLLVGAFWVALAAAYGVYLLLTIEVEHPIGRLLTLWIIGAFVAINGLMVVRLGRQAFSQKPSLLLTREGVTFSPEDRAQNGDHGWVAWGDVEQVRVVTGGGQPFVQLDVIDPQKYLRQGNLIQRLFSRLNYRWYGSPVHLSHAHLEVGFDDLLALIRRYYERSKAAQESGI